MAKKEDRELLTLDEIARYLRVSPWTVYRFVRNDRLPCYRLGHQWRFRKSLVDRWLGGKRTDIKKRAKG